MFDVQMADAIEQIKRKQPIAQQNGEVMNGQTDATRKIDARLSHSIWKELPHELNWLMTTNTTPKSGTLSLEFLHEMICAESMERSRALFLRFQSPTPVTLKGNLRTALAQWTADRDEIHPCHCY